MAGPSFAQQLAMAQPAIEPLLLALADAFHPVDHDAATRAVDRLAGRLDGVPDVPAAQLTALGERVLAPFDRPAGVGCPSTIDDLLLHRVLRDRRGDELLVAAVGVIVGQRRGWDVGVVRGGGHVLVGHAGVAPLVASVRDDGRVLDARDLRCEEDLWWCEPHGLAALVLERLAARADELGLHPHALRAAELQCALPLEPREHLTRAVQLARVRARFN